MHSMSVTGEILAQAGFGESGDADDALMRRRPPGEPRQRRPDLSADPEDDEIARQLLELRRQGCCRRGHHLFEMLDVAETVRQLSKRFRHPASSIPHEHRRHDGVQATDWILERFAFVGKSPIAFSRFIGSRVLSGALLSGAQGCSRRLGGTLRATGMTT